jgi:hypothetical protein
MFAKLSLNVGIPWRRLTRSSEGDIEMGDRSDSDVEDICLSDDTLSDAGSPTRHDSMAEIIPDFQPLWIPPFDPWVPVVPTQATESRHGRPVRHPWRVFSEMAGRRMFNNIRQESRTPRSADFERPPLPTIEETARELHGLGQYAPAHVAFPFAYEEDIDRASLVPSDEDELYYTFAEYEYEGETYRAEDDNMEDPPPPYRESEPNGIHIVPNTVPNLAHTSRLYFGPSFAHNTGPDDPMDAASDIAMRTAHNTALNTGTNTIHTMQAPRTANQSDPRNTKGRISKSMFKCVGGIRTARDVPKAMRNMREQHKVRKAKTKMSWLEKNKFISRDGSLLHAEL